MIRFLVATVALSLCNCRSEPAPVLVQPVAGEIRDEFGMVFVPIPRSSNGASLVGPNAFYMGRYEVTQEQWARIMGNNPSAYKALDHPVENVSWLDVQDFIEKLNDAGTGWRYRLPTGKEWEHGCRAGADTAYAFGDNPALLDDYAWTRRNAGKRHHPVGTKRPNAWGLHDMHGNVWEWCAGGFGSPDTADSEKDGADRVYRGGSFHYHPVYARADARLVFSEKYGSIFTGFRLIAEPPGLGD